jgi:hypothetical protein
MSSASIAPSLGYNENDTHDDTTQERITFYTNEFLTEFNLSGDSIIPTTNDGSTAVDFKANELFTTMISQLPRRMRTQTGTSFISLRYTLKSGLLLDIILESAKTNPHGCLSFVVYNEDEIVDKGDFASMSDYCPRMRMRDIPSMPVSTYKTIQYVKTHIMGDSLHRAISSEYDYVDDTIAPFDPDEIARQKEVASIQTCLDYLDRLNSGDRKVNWSY